MRFLSLDESSFALWVHLKIADLATFRVIVERTRRIASCRWEFSSVSLYCLLLSCLLRHHSSLNWARITLHPAVQTHATKDLLVVVSLWAPKNWQLAYTDLSAAYRIDSTLSLSLSPLSRCRTDSICSKCSHRSEWERQCARWSITCDSWVAMCGQLTDILQTKKENRKRKKRI